MAFLGTHPIARAVGLALAFSHCAGTTSCHFITTFQVRGETRSPLFATGSLIALSRNTRPRNPFAFKGSLHHAAHGIRVPTDRRRETLVVKNRREFDLALRVHVSALDHLRGRTGFAVA
jgi:hypothetical protein